MVSLNSWLVMKYATVVSHGKKLKDCTLGYRLGSSSYIARDRGFCHRYRGQQTVEGAWRLHGRHNMHYSILESIVKLLCALSALFGRLSTRFAPLGRFTPSFFALLPSFALHKNYNESCFWEKPNLLSACSFCLFIKIFSRFVPDPKSLDFLSSYDIYFHFLLNSLQALITKAITLKKNMEITDLLFFLFLSQFRLSWLSFFFNFRKIVLIEVKLFFLFVKLCLQRDLCLQYINV